MITRLGRRGSILAILGLIWTIIGVSTPLADTPHGKDRP